MRLGASALVVLTAGLGGIAGGTVGTVCFAVSVVALVFTVVVDAATSTRAERRRDFLSFGLIGAGVLLIAVSRSVVVLVAVMAAFVAGLGWDTFRDTSGSDA